MSFDGMETPGRNDECWCGSGKKYKKCHRDLDDRLEELASQGFEVLPRMLLKSSADIEGIKHSAEVNVGALDYVAEHIGPGVSTGEIDDWVSAVTASYGAVVTDQYGEEIEKLEAELARLKDAAEEIDAGMRRTEKRIDQYK